MDVAPEFVEIDYAELEISTVVGRGAFGVVSRARWRGMDVAVKLIQTESERRAFTTELKQLSRVSHPNIVKLYGACTKAEVCLVMEYAEGGSVYNVLHADGPQQSYSAGHAMSWCLQCAKGVEYLHGMKPKALIHRDLKPPNLLLIRDGTELKICDFGTACDAQTHMTNNKGSAAWMAPEVFEGVNYSEKCDVYSWGVILWEVLARRKPFDEQQASAFMILWSVHQGKRPPLIKNCPKPIEQLMTKCWSKYPLERPAMREVVRVMGHLCKFFTGADKALGQPELERGRQLSSQSSREASAQTIQQTVRDLTRLQLGEMVPLQQPVTPTTRPVVVEESSVDEVIRRRTSAPASLAASHESLLNSSRCSTPSADVVSKRYSADLSHLDRADIAAAGDASRHNARHRRTGSHGNTCVFYTGNTLSPSMAELAPGSGHRRSGSYGNASQIGVGVPFEAGVTTSPVLPMHHATTAPGDLGEDTVPSQPVPPDNRFIVTQPITGNMYHMNAAWNMEDQLQPLQPDPKNRESMTIYHEHLLLAQKKINVQAEIMLLRKRRDELHDQLLHGPSPQQNSARYCDEYEKLTNENESLDLLYRNIKRQVELAQRPTN